MTEAVRAVTKMTFNDFKARRIEIRVDAKNHRSRRVAERAGYLLEGIQINALREKDDQLHDMCMYASTC
jgi:ribosomal-protein-serine acetyltransferase